MTTGIANPHFEAGGLQIRRLLKPHLISTSSNSIINGE